ncbi:MAG: biotin--[acetyl-CoA-carboxylase] ligase [Candidatus Omnitrophica bacterium]|nr:biotin--[acetyl-CoA-carboxylase] ligase [Candidatus Omnitrophota bacterium]
MDEEAILNSLRGRSGTYVSGEELSQILGVSRTAIWKEIQRLRSEGYKIIAQPHAGYQLTGVPDRLIPQELVWNLPIKRIGKRIYSYESTESTMDIAHRLASAGEKEGSIVVAEGQGKGRGRLGRTWVSPKGKGLYASLILRPCLHLSEAALITLMAAVSVVKAIENRTGLTAEIKWPNDVLIAGRKVAGILTELNAELNRVNYVILGIGVNLNSRRPDLPSHATSLLEETGEKVDRIGFARALFLELDRFYETFSARQFDTILEIWRRHAGFLGKRVRVAAEGRTVDGQAVDVDDTGALLVRTDTGLVESVSAGEVLVVR